MKYQGVCIAVSDVKLAQKFYQDLFGLEVFQDYGINISFGGLSLQQDFDRLLNLPKKKMLKESHNMELYFEEDDFDAKQRKKQLIFLNTFVQKTALNQSLRESVKCCFFIALSFPKLNPAIKEQKEHAVMINKNIAINNILVLPSYWRWHALNNI